MASGMAQRSLATLLEQLERLRRPLDAWVVCGRSPDLLDIAHASAERAPGPVRILPFGFLRDVPLRMAAADVAAGKPGGLTASEVLAAGLPFVIVDPYPLQEEANALYLLERGAALRVEPLTTFGHKLGGLLADPGRRARMAEAARAAARPDAAATVVAACERLLEERS
jgi:processive 1,2-diacylglycerol beta-glucosyltransferase